MPFRVIFQSVLTHKQHLRCVYNAHVILGAVMPIPQKHAYYKNHHNIIKDILVEFSEGIPRIVPGKITEGIPRGATERSLKEASELVQNT